MGLASLALSALSRVGSLFGGGAATAAGGGAARIAGGGILSALGRGLISPVGQGLAGGIAGAGLGSAFFAGGGGDGAMAGSQLAQIQASGGQVTPLAGGRFLAVAPNGDMQVFNRNGQAIKPTMIIPAGQRLPGGALVVSTRQNGALIGITKRRRRRRFGAEIRTVRRTVQAANALVNLCKPTKRRS